MKVKKPARKKFIRKTVKSTTPVEKPVAEAPIVPEEPRQLPEPHDMQIAPVSASAKSPVDSAVNEESSVQLPEESVSDDKPEVAVEQKKDAESDQSQKPSANESVVSAQPSWSKAQITHVDESSRGGSRKKLLFIIIVLVFICIAGGAISYFLAIPGQKKESEPEKKEEVMVEPTKEPVFERSAFSFEVLNGSGVTGAAAKTADDLKDLGYSIIKTGNADKQTYETSVLFLSDNVGEIEKEKLLSDLTELLAIASVSGELSDSTASARIILGKN